MKKILLLCLFSLAFPVMGHSQTQVAWETSFEAAKARAQVEGKPILLLHLLGRLDEELC